MEEATPTPSARAVFDGAVEIEAVEEQQAYVIRACGDDPDLRRKVEALLKAHKGAGSFLESPADDFALGATLDDSALRLREGPGSVIGPYKLLQQIGEGGMGVVFLAEQHHPVRRKVALKVVKPGMDSRQVLARFEAERQALAIMDHPNIAKVLDAGATDSSRPYFVMELVKGVPITEFCDQHQLTPRQRLELFAHVCHAVQHAHQKGVIHRDIKPSNVLVMMYDTTPVVKVIDFGVAKALGQELTDKTLFTGFAQLLGTPLYMSPEQAGHSALDVDTRSDVYSLGVLLYELLTGTTPFDKERFRRAAQDEIRRIIREEEPPKPSTRLSESKESLPSISAQRHTDPAKLTRLVRGELDWIVMKALEKERARRYETATGLARDIERYLRDEPVEACPPSFRYRFAKFARRHRVAVASAAGVLACLIVLAVSLTYALQESRSADRMRGEQQQTVAALAQAEHYRGLAERSSAVLALERGLNYCEQGEIAHGLLWLGRSLERAPGGATDLQHAARANIGAWRARLGHRLRHIWEHAGAVQAVGISPDGTTALTGANDHTARLWDVASGAPIGEPLRHRQKDVRAASFSPDGKLILTAENYAARLWDARSRHPLGAPIQHDQILLAASFSPDGARFATAVEGGEAFLWDTASRQRLGGVPRTGYSSSYLCFRPDGGALVLGSRQPQVWDLTSFDRVGSGTDDGVTATAGRVTAAIYRHGRGDTILLGFESGRVFAWEAGQQVSPQFPAQDTFHRLHMEHIGRVTAIGYAPNGGPLWTADGAGKVRFWDATTHDPIGVTIQHRTGVNAVAVTPDGTAVLTGSGDGRARVWDLLPPKPPARPASPARGLVGLAFAPDGNVLATGGHDGIVEFWDVRTGTRLGDVRKHPQRVFDVAFSPDGKLLLTSCRDFVARLWPVEGGAALPITFKHKNPVLSATFSRDGRRVVSGTGDAIAQVWDASSGEPLAPPMKHAHMVHSVAFSPDGTRVLTGCEDGSATIWNAATGERDGEPLVHRGPVRAVAWSPDGSVVMTGVWGDGTAWLWDVATRRPITPPLLHREHVVAVAYHPGGKFVATASADGTARLWDPATGKPIGPSMELQKNLGLRALAFSPDGKSVAAGSLHTAGVRLWQVPAPAEGTPPEIVTSIKILTGMELDEDGLFQMLDARRWNELRDKIAASAHSPP